MKVLNLLKERHQTIWFEDKLVSSDDIAYIVECMKQVPSKDNKYPYEIYIVHGEGYKKFGDWLVFDKTWCTASKDHSGRHMAETLETPNSFRRYKSGIVNPGETRIANYQYRAPLKIMFVSGKTGCEENIDQIEIGLTAQAVVLACQEIGLGISYARCLGKFNKEITNKLLKNVSSNIENPRIRLTLCIGYPNEKDSYQGEDISLTDTYIDKSNNPVTKRTVTIEKDYRDVFNKDGQIFARERKNIPAGRLFSNRKGKELTSINRIKYIDPERIAI